MIFFFNIVYRYNTLCFAHFLFCMYCTLSGITALKAEGSRLTDRHLDWRALVLHRLGMILESPAHNRNSGMYIHVKLFKQDYSEWRETRLHFWKSTQKQKNK